MGNGGGAPVLSHSLTPLGVQGLESEGAQAQDLRAPPPPQIRASFFEESGGEIQRETATKTEGQRRRSHRKPRAVL